MSYLNVYVHVVSGVLLVGYALFWVVMVNGLRRSHDVVDADRLLGTLATVRWPPFGVGVTLPALGWAFLGVLAATGGFLLSGAGPTASAPAMSPPLIGKLSLFLLLTAGHAAAAWHCRAWILYANGLLTLALVLVSAFV